MKIDDVETYTGKDTVNMCAPLSWCLNVTTNYISFWHNKLKSNFTLNYQETSQQSRTKY